MLLMIVKAKDTPLIRCKPDLEHEGFVVDLTHDGMDGDRKVRSSKYEIVILDPKLPNADGFALLKNWRRDGIAADVLLLTAKKNTEDEVLGLDLGADGCLSRPFHFQELRARVQALLRRRGVHQFKDPVRQVHDLEIDTNARTVKRRGRFIHLNPREFSLLELLALHQGKLVTRRMIRDHLKIEPHTESNVIYVYISYLRAKIDRGFDVPLILTRWGKGILLRPEKESSKTIANYAV